MSLEESQGHALVYSIRDMERMLEQQREECAVDAVKAFQEADTMAAIPNAIMRACLNAIGESDDT